LNGRLVACLAALCVAWPVAGQRGTEWQAGAVGALSSSTYMGAGASWARRAGRVRASLGATVGALDAQAAARGEVLLGSVLTPGRRRGAGVYAVGGVAVTGTADAHTERLVAALGIEGTPGGRRGWFLEVGVGGGVRVAAGYRWRTLRR